MTHEDPGIEPHDATAIAAFEDALREFTQELNRLHIANGAPSYATMVSASVRPKLTKAGLNEMLAGKRFASLEALREFVRVVTTPRDLDPTDPPAAGFRADPALAADWRSRWQDVKLLQRQAQPANKRFRATVRQTLDDAAQEAEAVREDARAEAARIRTSAEAEAVRVRAQAQHDADELLHRARQTAEQAHGSPTREGADLNSAARAAGSGGQVWQQAKGLVLRPALRPLAAATAVAGLALAAILTGDSLTGTSGNCQPGQTQAADRLIPQAGLQGRGTVHKAAFAHKPEAFIPFATNQALPPAFGFPSGPSSSPSTDASPTPSTAPTPSPTPTPTPTPSTAPTPTASPAPRKPDHCAPQARAR